MRRAPLILGLVLLALAPALRAEAPGASPRPVARNASDAQDTEAAPRPSISSAGAGSLVPLSPGAVGFRPAPSGGSVSPGGVSVFLAPRSPAPAPDADPEPPPAGPAGPAATRDLDAISGPEIGLAVALPDRASPSPGALPLLLGPARRQPPPTRLPGSSGTGLCGDPGIEGTRVARIPGRLEGCGLDEGVSVVSIDGVGLSQASVLDCPTAQALAGWLRDGAIPALAGIGGGLARIEVSGSYVCRPRNNIPGAQISEHGRGRAIDISGLSLQDGNRLTVLLGWGDYEAGAALRRMHEAACSHFATVLGPNANAQHRDHFHFDTARTRRASYCR